MLQQCHNVAGIMWFFDLLSSLIVGRMTTEEYLKTCDLRLLLDIPWLSSVRILTKCFFLYLIYCAIAGISDFPGNNCQESRDRLQGTERKVPFSRVTGRGKTGQPTLRFHFRDVLRPTLIFYCDYHIAFHWTIVFKFFFISIGFY